MRFSFASFAIFLQPIFFPIQTQHAYIWELREQPTNVMFVLEIHFAILFESRCSRRENNIILREDFRPHPNTMHPKT